MESLTIVHFFVKKMKKLTLKKSNSKTFNDKDMRIVSGNLLREILDMSVNFFFYFFLYFFKN